MATGNGADLTVNRVTPVVDFTSADFESIKDDLITYAQTKYPDRWTDFNANQWAVVLLEMMAYIGDLLCYQINSTVRETFAATVIRRQNLNNIGKPYNYSLSGAVPATIDLLATLDPNGTYPTTIEQTDQYSNGLSGDSQVIFHPTNDIIVNSYPAGGQLNIPCTEGTYFESILIGVSTGLPNQRWQLPQQGIYAPSITIVVGSQTWTLSANLTLNQSTDQVFKVVQTDDGNTFVIFGDGVFGAIPTNTTSIYATFNQGGGIQGNSTPNTVQTKVSANPIILTITNPAQGDGGAPEQSMTSGRNGIAAFLSTLKRGVTTNDYAQLAVLIPGVAKARAASGLPVGTRAIRIWIAPAGGGVPTQTLKSLVSSSFNGLRMVTNRVQPYSAFYRNLQLVVLLHVNSAFRASDVLQAVSVGLSNNQDTGFLDFNQLDFEGVSKDSNGNEEWLITQTALQSFFNGFKSVGLDRAEIQQLTVTPQARTPNSGNTGNGTVSVLTWRSLRRRQFYIVFFSALQYYVYERITGYVTGISDNSLFDDSETFDAEGVANYGTGYTVMPNADTPGVTFPVVSAVGTTLVALTGGASLLAATSVGQQYFVFGPPTLVTVGSGVFTSADGSVTFSIAQGSTPFISNDSFVLDIYPNVGDVRLAKDEYPEFTMTSSVLRTSGGSAV